MVVYWNAEIIDENGLRNSFGQNWVNLSDIYGIVPSTPEELPLKCFVGMNLIIEMFNYLGGCELLSSFNSL